MRAALIVFAGRWRAGCTGLAAIVLLLLSAQPAAAADLVIDAAGEPIVIGIINGVPMRLKVELDRVEGITLNADAAARAGLGEGDGEWVERIGPIKLEGRSTKLRLTLGGVETGARVRWRSSPAAFGADGTVSIHSLPFDSVVLQRGTAGPNEREMSFQTRMHDNHGVHYRLHLGKSRIAVRFSLSRPRTTAPAAAAAIIAERQGGQLGEERSTEEIVPGVARPVRTLRLARALPIGSFAVRALMARTTDFRGEHHLAWAEPPSGDGDIVVTGERESQEALYRITLGLDVLGRCSSATYRRGTGELRLRCAGD